jgi:hypothetical protein
MYLEEDVCMYSEEDVCMYWEERKTPRRRAGHQERGPLVLAPV